MSTCQEENLEVFPLYNCRYLDVSNVKIIFKENFYNRRLISHSKLYPSLVLLGKILKPNNNKSKNKILFKNILMYFQYTFFIHAKYFY